MRYSMHDHLSFFFTDASAHKDSSMYMTRLAFLASNHNPVHLTRFVSHSPQSTVHSPIIFTTATSNAGRGPVFWRFPTSLRMVTHEIVDSLEHPFYYRYHPTWAEQFCGHPFSFCRSFSCPLRQQLPSYVQKHYPQMRMMNRIHRCRNLMNQSRIPQTPVVCEKYSIAWSFYGPCPRCLLYSRPR